MTSRAGFIALARGVLDHPIVGARKPYAESEAWLWLLFEAAWRARRVRVTNGRTVGSVGIERGQLSYSRSYMATAWGWSEKRVRTFLNRLETDRMIAPQTGQPQTVITICNYETYQNPETSRGRQPDGQTGQQWAGNGPETEQGNKEKEVPSARAASPSSDPKTQLYQRGIEILGENSGGVVSSLLKAKGTVPSARSALESSAEKANPREYIRAIIRNTTARAVDAGGLAYDSAL